MKYTLQFLKGLMRVCKTIIIVFTVPIWFPILSIYELGADEHENDPYL